MLNKGVDGCVEEKFDEIRIGLGIKTYKFNARCNGYGRIVGGCFKRAEFDDLGWMNGKS